MIYLIITLIAIIVLLILSNFTQTTINKELNNKREIDKQSFNNEKVYLLSLLSRFAVLKIETCGNIEIVEKNEVEKLDKETRKN